MGCGDEGSGALAAPEVDAVDSPTNADPLTLEGSALAGATVEVRGGADAVASAVVDDTGRFAVDVALRADARQTLLISQRAGGEESPATELDVVHDGTAPEAPEVDPPATPTRRDALMLAGAAEAGATIEVRGGADEVATGGVDAEGRFELAVRLRTELAMLTQNELEVVAVDAAGNASAAAMVTVVHNPNLPLEAPTLDETPAATRERTLTLRGDTEPGAEVLVDGGAEATEGRADETGRFLVEVTLRPNTAHTLRVIARHPETGVASPAAMRSVVHDDIAPEPPNVDPLASPTGAESALAAGASEPGAAIEVSGGEADALGTADEAGAFRVLVPLVADRVNTLAFVARDAAGNASEPTVVEVEQDGSLPTPVEVEPVPSPTATNPITLRGRTEADATLQVSGGATPVEVVADGEGRFTAEVTLEANARSELRVARVGSEVETVIVVVHDDLAPDAPVVDPVASPTGSRDVTLTGSAEPGARVNVSGGEAAAAGDVGESGRWVVPVRIAEDAETTLTLVASDRAGNASAPLELAIAHSSSVPAAPSVDDPAPAPTNVAAHVVSGSVAEARAGLSVEVRGGAETAMAEVSAETGAFSVDVALAANTENVLEVVVLEGALESAPAFVSIVHDDIAPDAPDAGAISVGSPGGLGCLLRGSVNVTGGAGAVEAQGRVRIENVTAETGRTASADGEGSFSGSVPACDGDLLSLTVMDAAGNASEATEIAVGD
ncbi:MAG: hypothetical protein CMN31_01455 [Sandaracinus sp.]|nr:hypothetical protein [Sandaracinus sp.]MBJ70028.1 hypothetical protein [Sandaracinus sp.]